MSASFLFKGIETLALEITKKCPLDCSYCYNRTSGGGGIISENELEFTDWKSIITRLPQINQIVLTGGDPLLREDIGKLCDILNRKCKEVILLSSGIPDPPIALLKRYSIHFQIQISDIGCFYNEVSNAGDSFSILEKNILSLNMNGMAFTTSVVISRRNLNRLGDILDFHLAAGSRHILAIRYIPVSNGNPDDKNALSPKDYINALDIVNTFAESSGLPISLGIPDLPCISSGHHFNNINKPVCSAGIDYLTIDQEGFLKLCPLSPRISGPLTTSDWNSISMDLEKARAEYLDISQLTYRCRSCRYVEYCNGGCRSGGYLNRCSDGHKDPLLSPQ